MPVDPAVLALLEQMFPPGSPRLPELPLDAARRVMDLALPLAGEPAAGVAVENRTLSGIPVRVYRPGEGERPVCVYFHGGGWTLGRLDHYDTLCSRLAEGSGWTVVSVEYRLAPEHKFPAPVLDCWTALLAVRAHAGELGVDAGRVAVAGDSAGGNLAAVVSLLARDYGVPLAGQVLIYPVTDYVAPRPSYAFDHLLSREDILAFWRYYLYAPEEASSPLAAPLRAASLAGVAPAYVLTAEFDPLRDEGEEYARKLGEAGVPVTLRRYPGMVHGFANFGGAVPAAREAVREIAAWLLG
jgi:acetyl esterase